MCLSLSLVFFSIFSINFNQSLGNLSFLPRWIKRIFSFFAVLNSFSRVFFIIEKILFFSVKVLFQFSVENPQSVTVWTPKSRAASKTFLTALAPRSCPLVTGSPRDLAQRPFPSRIMAMWSGTFVPFGRVIFVFLGMKRLYHTTQKS